MRKPVHLIAAVAANNVIGADGGLPWKSREDLARFARLTKGCALVMGRKTYESIGRPLPGRMTIVVSRNRRDRLPGCEMRASIEDALAAADERPGKVTWVAGGAEIYRQTIGLADGMSISHFENTYQGDAFFPDIDESAWEAISKENIDTEPRHTFVVYNRR